MTIMLNLVFNWYDFWICGTIEILSSQCGWSNGLLPVVFTLLLVRRLLYFYSKTMVCLWFGNWMIPRDMKFFVFEWYEHSTEWIVERFVCYWQSWYALLPILMMVLCIWVATVINELCIANVVCAFSMIPKKSGAMASDNYYWIGAIA